ncbi:hypothetical protein NLI96_g11974 [Meripilus lineatus]|uniref:BTB domain-containing protein n=1 Tax=Meripilus lineatus TaxID=2056292 RepID=A0AAD5UQS1_9APHY|nr:hypothetical protein NLI96_g11974 [Physisporinus lineatus]
MGQNDNTGPSSILNGVHNSITQENPRQHPTYWFKDGSLLIQVQSSIYRIHGSLLDRHSPVISTLARSSNPTYDLPQVHIPEERRVSVADFEVLLEHLYHDMYVASTLMTVGQQQTSVPYVDILKDP